MSINVIHGLLAETMPSIQRIEWTLTWIERIPSLGLAGDGMSPRFRAHRPSKLSRGGHRLSDFVALEPEFRSLLTPGIRFSASRLSGYLTRPSFSRQVPSSVAPHVVGPRDDGVNNL